MQSVKQWMLGIGMLVGVVALQPLQADHFYGALMAKKTPFAHQAYIADERISRFLDHIDEQWEDGYYIGDIHYAGDTWMAAMNHDGKKHLQRIVKARDWDDFLKMSAKAKKDGYALINIEGGEGFVVGAFEKGAQPTKLKRVRYWEEFTPLLKDHIEKGYAVADVEPYAGYIYVLFAKNKHYAAQKFTLIDEWEDGVAGEIKRRWRRGYNLKSMEYGYGKWFLYFVKEKEERGERYIIREEYEDFVRNIEKEWKKGYKITDLLDGY